MPKDEDKDKASEEEKEVKNEEKEDEVVEESRPKAVVEEVSENQDSTDVTVQDQQDSSHEEPAADSSGEQQTEDQEPELPEKSGGNFKVIFITALLTAIIVAALAGGVYVYLSGVDKLPDVSVQRGTKEIPTATPTPTPTPEPEVDLSQYSVQVLNGSGTSGAASSAERLLVEAGFVVEDTGNAATFDFTNTVIQAKEDVPEAVVDEVKTALSSDYSVEVGDALKTSDTYDIVVTVGSE